MKNADRTNSTGRDDRIIIEDLERQLQQSRKLLELSDCYQIILDKRNRLEYISPNLVYLLGLDHEEMKGLTPDFFIHEDDRAAYKAYSRKRGDKGKSLIHRFKGTGAESLWFETRLVIPDDHDFQVKYLIIRNITDRFRLKTNLEIADRRFESISANLPFVLLRYNRKLEHEYVSRNISGFLPFEPEEFIGQGFAELGFGKEKVSFFEDLIKGVFEGKGETETEFEQETQSGSRIFSLKLIPESDTSGEIFSVLGILKEVNELEVIRRKLSLSEEKFRLIFETIPDSVVLSRLSDGLILDVNRGFLNLLGYKPEEVVNRTSVEIGMFPDSKAREEFVSSFKSGPVLNKALSFPDRNNKQVQLAISAAPIVIEKENLLITILRDMSGLLEQQQTIKKSHRQLKLSEEKFRAFVDLSPDGIVITDELGRIREWNRSIEKFTGISKEVAIGNSPFDIQRMIERKTDRKPSDRDFVEKQVKKLLSRDVPLPDPKTFYVKFPHHHRGNIELENTLFVFESEHGRRIGVISRDISEKKQIEENALLYKNIFENSLDGVAILDLRGNYLEINEAHSRIIGYKDSEIIGKNPSMFLGSKLYDEVFKVFNFQGIFEGELEASHKSGRGIFLDYILFPVVSDSVQICSVEITRDITPRKHSEKELIEAKRKAEESDHLKTAFLSNMSHEIRTPMNSILGFSALLERPGLSYSQRVKYLSFINKNGENLLRLIGDIIDIAKIESNQLTINKENGDLTVLMNNLYSNMSKLLEKEGKTDVVLKSSFDREKGLKIYTDFLRLEQVLVNLIFNAIKFTHQGSIEFGYRQTGKDWLEFFVRDTGIGIPEERLDDIFKRFHKLEHSRKKLYGGAGLGLAISNQLVQLLGGKIRVESEKNKGSVFFFTIPLETLDSEQVFPSAEIVASKFYWPGKTILIIEDDIYSTELLNEYMEGTGLRCIFAEDGKKGYEVFLENRDVNLILMDVQLPHRNGLELTRMIREQDSRIPIIAQTAFAMDDDRLQALEAGCNDFLTKPLSHDQFLKTLARYLG